MSTRHSTQVYITIGELVRVSDNINSYSSTEQVLRPLVKQYGQYNDGLTRTLLCLLLGLFTGTVARLRSKFCTSLAYCLYNTLYVSTLYFSSKLIEKVNT